MHHLTNSDSQSEISCVAYNFFFFCSLCHNRCRWLCSMVTNKGQFKQYIERSHHSIIISSPSTRQTWHLLTGLPLLVREFLPCAGHHMKFMKSVHVQHHLSMTVIIDSLSNKAIMSENSCTKTVKFIWIRLLKKYRFKTIVAKSCLLAWGDSFMSSKLHLNMLRNQHKHTIRVSKQATTRGVKQVCRVCGHLILKKHTMFPRHSL